jgi:uncharacterized membrane protein
MHPRLTVPGCLVVLAAAGVVAAPTVAAACNDSSGTIVCAQGDIRGTNAPPPSRADVGPIFGAWCRGGSCFGGSGFGIIVAP